jgi:transposase
MFGLGPATRIYLGVDAIDMRKGFNGLYGLVRDHLGHDPLSGHLFLFTNRSRTRIKALVAILAKSITQSPLKPITILQ